MSTSFSVDLQKYVNRIRSMLCKDCRRKFDKLPVPVSQTMTTEQLFPPEAKPDKKGGE
jgi:hypothetical protein